ncbi:MAG: hypothetical protein P1V35_13335, partial [Planctomycetota bacterium]|nr:hypothetical protein [Planctomycetota bacterium]
LGAYHGGMKLLLKITIIVLLGIGALGAAGYFLLPPAARGAIEDGTGNALGTNTHLTGIDAGFGLNTSLGIVGFTADQPKGFEGPPMLEIGSINVGVDLISTLTNTVKVREVALDGLHLRLVQNGKESNFLQVYESLRRLTEGGEPSTTEGEEDSGSGKSIDIGLVKVSGVGATFDLTGIPGIEQSYSFELPAFEVDMSKLANEKRLQSVEQATALIMEKLIEGTVAQAQAQVSPELALLIGGDVAGLKDRVHLELDKLKGRAQTEIDTLKNKAQDQLKGKLGESLEGALGGEKADKIKDAIGDKASDLLEKGADAVLEGDTSETLKKEADKLIKDGSGELRDKLGGLLKKKD